MVYGHQPPSRRRTPEQIAGDIAKGIEDAAEALRWAKTHLHERRAPDTLRLIELNLSYLAQALDSQAEGEDAKAEAAVDRIWWQPQTDDGPDTAPQGH